MFLFEYIFIIIGAVLLFFSLLLCLFDNKIFDILNDHGLKSLFFAFGIAFCLFPLFCDLFFNRCEVCEKFVSTDYCTACGSYVASDSLCSCGSELDERYSYCPSCGKDLEVSHD